MNQCRTTTDCPLTTRRSWLRGLLSLASVSAPGFWLGQAEAGNGLGGVRLRLSEFPALQSDGGSVIFTFNQGVTAVMVNRESSTTFHGMSPVCTHAGCQVDKYNSLADEISCGCHGSTFSIDGRVTGGPAEEDLPSFATSFDGVDAVTVQVPGLDVSIRSIAVHSLTVTTRRLRLTFPTTELGRYRVLYTPDLTSIPQQANFSTTPGGAATQNLLTGNGNVMNAYVDVPAGTTRGFLTLRLLLTEY